ncbi:MAG TPA: hypothetical protein VMT62_05820 [Syntrophorhabdaceae bacterium]|nr:hypothetical protein [Syntrophorhabdaceae bacterium]
MTYAAIDIGTNTILMLIARATDTIEEIEDVSSITRLGEGLKRNGYLLDAAINRSVEVVMRYAGIAKSYDVDKVFCVGTSALREAANSGRFLKRVQDACGISVQIISGDEEAYYTYLAVMTDGLIGGHDLFVVDIGGGSTEMIAGDREHLADLLSLPIGTVKLTEMFVKTDPPEEREIESTRTHIRTLLTKPLAKGNELVCVGTGGTITTLGAVMLGLGSFDKERIHGLALSLNDVRDIILRLKAMDRQERVKVPGIETGREDVITQGAILLEEIMAYHSFAGCVISTKGVRHGVMLCGAGLAPDASDILQAKRLQM